MRFVGIEGSKSPPTTTREAPRHTPRRGNLAGVQATVQVWMRVPRTMLPALAVLADRHGTTRSAVLRRSLEVYLSQHTDWQESKEEDLP